MLLPSRFSSNRSSRARSTQSFACSVAAVCCSDTSQLSACGLSQNCATSSRNSGPAANSCLRRGCVPYSSLLVRFRSSIRVRSFSLWVRMPPAFCRAVSGRTASRSSCSAQPRISASGVRTSWLTPAIHWVRASSRRASSSFRVCSCALVRFSFSASSPAKPFVGNCTVCPSASASSPEATVSSRLAPCQLSRKQQIAASSNSSPNPSGMVLARLRMYSGEV